jgi:hypothetical protein
MIGFRSHLRKGSKKMEIYFNVSLPRQFKMKSIVCKDEDDVVKVLSKLPLYTKFDNLSVDVFAKQQMRLDFGVPLEKDAWNYVEGEEIMDTEYVVVEPMLIYNSEQADYLANDYIDIKQEAMKRHAEKQEKLLEVELEDDSD